MGALDENGELAFGDSGFDHFTFESLIAASDFITAVRL